MVSIKEKIKKCSYCNKYLTVRNFYKNGKTKDGYFYECKACHNQRGIRRYKEKREFLLKQQDDRKKEYKLKVFNFFGNKCACCGETNKLFLQIDHVHNDGFLDKRNNTSYYKKIFENVNSGKYQILCANCNWGKRLNNGVCPHKAK